MLQEVEVRLPGTAKKRAEPWPTGPAGGPMPRSDLYILRMRLGDKSVNREISLDLAPARTKPCARCRKATSQRASQGLASSGMGFTRVQPFASDETRAATKAVA